jgi:peptidoglycan/xylan/chitin deacetylase (PgdA/CDA1 family)
MMLPNQPIPILLYHSISEPATRQFAECAILPRAFREQMAYLGQSGYVPIPLANVCRAILDDEVPLPRRPVVLTFDDAYLDFYTEALPVLRQHGFPATLYVPTAYVGQTSRWLRPEGEHQRPMLSWAQLEEIQRSGLVDCGAHSHTHPQLDVLPPAVAREEVVRCKTILEAHLAAEVSSFAYPFGFYNAAARDLVRAAGYRSACAVKHAMSSTRDDLFALARIAITRQTTIDQFGRLLEGHRLPQARERLTTRARWSVRRGLKRLGLGRPDPAEERLGVPAR